MPTSSGGEQGPLHEVVGEQLRSRDSSGRSSGPAAGARSAWPRGPRRRGGARVQPGRRRRAAGEVGRGAVEGHVARRARSTMRPTMRLAARPSSWVTRARGAAGGQAARSVGESTCWLAGSTPAVGSSMISTSGSAGERAGDQHPPLLAAGEGADVLVARSARPTSSSASRTTARSRPFCRPNRRWCGSRPMATTSSTVAGTPPTSGVPLRHVAEPGQCSRKSSIGVPNSRHLAAEVVVQPEQPAHQRGLARAVGRRAAPRPRRAAREVDVGHRRSLAVAERGRAQRRGRRSVARARAGRSRAALSGAQRREVGAHDRKVVGAARTCGQALDRVEDVASWHPSPGPRCRRSRG